jgi:ssDNA-binding Zn-finger/Zn-ribbon topoisomerase 1
MVAVVETMSCRDCRQLVDVLIGKHGREGPTGDRTFDTRLGRCPNCRGTNVSAWKAPRACPKCDGRMLEGQLIALWD